MTRRMSTHTQVRATTLPCAKGSKKKVLPGIEPGLPEDTDFDIRIRSDNRYLEWLLAGASEKCEVGKRTLQNRYRIEIWKQYIHNG
jgi:hypothetical protein